MFTPVSARRTGERAIIGHPDSMNLRAVGVLGATVVVVAGFAAAGLGVAHAATDDEQRVRTVLEGMNASYNKSDFAGFASHLCDDLLNNAGFAADWYRNRREDGETRITVNSVTVAGADAVANVRFEAANRDDTKTMDIEFVRDGSGQNTDWKACNYETGRAV